MRLIRRACFLVKRVGNIYNKVCDLDNIKKAIYKSSLGKRKQNRVSQIINNIDIYAGKIQKMLLSKRYVPSPYKIKAIEDGATKKNKNYL